MTYRRAILAGILLLSVALRLPALWHAGLWRDEAYLYTELSAPTFGEFFHRFSQTEYFPPLYFVLMYVWTAIAGISEVALKFPSFALSILTVVAVYRLGCVAQDARAGMVASFLYAIMPLDIVPAADVRPYSLLALIVTLLATALLQMRQSGTRALFVQTAVLALLAVYTHYLALVAVAAFALFSFVEGVPLKSRARTASAILLGALPFVFWLPNFLNQMANGIPWKAPSTSLEKISAFAGMLLQGIPTESWAAAAIVAVLIAAALHFGPVRANASILAGVFVTVLLLEAAAGWSDIRYVYPFYALFAVFEAGIFVQLWDVVNERGTLMPRALAVSAACVAVILTGKAAATAVASAAPHSGIRTLVSADPPKPRALYVIAPDYMAATFAYYVRNRPVPFIGFVRIRDPEFFNARGYARDWNDSSALTNVECYISRASSRYRSLVYVADRGTRDQWHIPYAKTWQLLAFLKARYPLEVSRSFAGTNESVSEYRFDRTSGPNILGKHQCASANQ